MECVNRDIHCSEWRILRPFAKWIEGNGEWEFDVRLEKDGDIKWLC